MSLDQRLTADVVRPVFVGLLDIKDDPVMGWTGPGVFAPTLTGDPDLDGNQFTSVEGAATISDFVESMSGSSGVSITFSGHDNDAEVMKQIIRDKRVWRVRKAKIWLFFLMDDEKTVHPEFRQLFSGVIAEVKSADQPSSPSAIVLDLDVDLQNAAGAPARWIDHQQFNLGDTWSSYILDLLVGPLAGPRNRKRVRLTSGGDRAGSSRDSFNVR